MKLFAQQSVICIVLLGLGLQSAAADDSAYDKPPEGMPAVPDMEQMMQSVPPEQAEMMRRMMSGEFEGKPNQLMQDMQGFEQGEKKRLQEEIQRDKQAQESARIENNAPLPPAPKLEWVSDFVTDYMQALIASSSLEQTQKYRSPNGQAYKEFGNSLKYSPQGAEFQLKAIKQRLNSCENTVVRIDPEELTAEQNGEYAYVVENNGSRGNYCFTMTLAPTAEGQWLIGFEQWGG